MNGARHPVAIGAGAAVCAAAAMAVTTLTTEGLAYASPPSVTGQTYSDASAALSGAGFTPVVATTVGDQKAWADCLVVNDSAADGAATTELRRLGHERSPGVAQLLFDRGIGHFGGILGGQPRGEDTRCGGQGKGRRGQGGAGRRPRNP